MVASRNSSLATSARRKPVLVVRPRIAVSSSAATSARRAASRSGPWAMTLPSIGSYDVLTTWPLSSACVDPGAGRASARGRRVPACGQEAAEGVLGVDPRLDRVPGDGDVVLGERQRLAGGDPQLELRPGRCPVISLGDRVLDLEPGVHLQEVGLVGVGVEQELHGAGVLVADLRGPARPPPSVTRRADVVADASAPAPPRAPSGAGAGSSSRARRGARRCRGRRRAPAPRCGGRARRTSRPAWCRRRTPTAPRASRRRRPRRSPRRARTMRMPLPPPPAAALTSTGNVIVGGRRVARVRRHDRHAGRDRDLAGGVLAAHLVHHRRRTGRPARARPPRRLGRTRRARTGSRSRGGSRRRRRPRAAATTASMSR